MSSCGWVKLHRKLQESNLWLCEPFSRGQAWVDLILLANHKPGHIRIAGERIELARGQCGWSEVNLAGRWQWSRNKVRRFISELECDQKVTARRNTRTTILTICNYESYQSKETTDDTTEIPAKPQILSNGSIEQEFNEKSGFGRHIKIEGIQHEHSNGYGLNGAADDTTDDTTERHQTIQQTDTNKNVNNGKNGKGAFVLPEWIPKEEWQALLEVRKQKRTPNTPHALKLLVSGLDKLRATGYDPVEVLNQSIVRGWAGVFKLSEDFYGKRQTQTQRKPTAVTK